ncbi:MAG: glycerol-3-phosphate dehydrogenase/oxidase [Phycisphaerales bacterium]|nr:glycerol-3-phosphate dehydrogenase/oxidase [Phycisphaerales bacterium]
MNRHESLKKVKEISQWDIIIIGGGATGLGAAVDAASRGLKTLLLEQYDFAKGTSSKATKLVHGGVRYLAQGNVSLVKHSLRERYIFLKNAPHLSHKQPFILPVYTLFQKVFYGFGLWIYELLAGKYSIGNTKLLSKKKVVELMPTAQQKHLKGGVLYYDGQFDDTRMCVDMALTATKQGAVILNYAQVVSLKTQDGKVHGLTFIDTLNQQTYEVAAQAIVNATGVYAEKIMQMDDDTIKDFIAPAQGIHLVVHRDFFPSDFALIIPKTNDGRVLFAVPWLHYIILGTTDNPVPTIDIEPHAMEKEVQFILDHFNHYTTKVLQRADVNAVFAGLRPLVKLKNAGMKTSALPRDHTIHISNTNFITITGGKWTTYRFMAEQVIDKAIATCKLPDSKCITDNLLIINPADTKEYKDLLQQHPELTERIHPDFHYQLIDVYYAIRYEMAMQVEDILLRRTRMFFLNPRVAFSCAPKIAKIMAQELQKDDQWIQQQCQFIKDLLPIYTLG